VQNLKRKVSRHGTSAVISCTFYSNPSLPILGEEHKSYGVSSWNFYSNFTYILFKFFTTRF